MPSGWLQVHEDADTVLERLPVEGRLQLRSDVEWVDCPELLLLPYGGRSFDVWVRGKLGREGAWGWEGAEKVGRRSAWVCECAEQVGLGGCLGLGRWGRKRWG